MASYEGYIEDEAKAKSSDASSIRARFESAHCNDAVVAEPSFDDGDGRGSTTEHRSDSEARPALFADHKKPGHSRNLSEHFYESARIPISDKSPTFSQEASRAVGQKYRHTFSGDVSNPPEARRRINSIGNAAPVSSRRPYLQDRQHQRVDSAGLDILTAAVDASQEELANAAGQRANPITNAHFDAGSGATRRSPAEIASYDHSSSAPGSNTVLHHRYPSGPSTGYYAPPGYGYPSPYYGPPGFPRTVPGAPPPPPGGYPVQYARGPDPYAAKSSQGPLHHLGLERPSEDPTKARTASFQSRPDRAPVNLEKSGEMIPPPPVHPSHWRGSSTVGSTHGVQTYVASSGHGEGSTLHANHQSQTGGEHDPASDAYHHRKSSSISSWAPPLSLLMGAPPADFGEHPLKRHHRTTSSSVSFLGLDVAALGDGDAAFLKNLHSSNGVNGPAFETKPLTPRSSQEMPEEEQSQDDGKSKLASGGTSKRVRRKCNIEGCLNRVVQGGLCISHGAKRKHCRYPGCTKNVKKAGLCSTHGPARKRCETDGCSKVAVQGGRCIAHGAKKKLCCIDGCTKQAILSGMCKKHHDTARKTSQILGQDDVLSAEAQCQPVSKPSRVVNKPTHTRGLSLFQEMSAEAVGNILGDGAQSAAAPSQHRHQSTFSRDFANMYQGGD